jgi:peptidoglycan/LPS O-acetylase OafA/YrhL
MMQVSEGNASLKFFFELLHDGNLGVNIFFILSGFLITQLLLFEEAGLGTINIRNFYWRRVFRILPAYYFFLLVLCLMQVTGKIEISSSSWLTAITFTKYLNWNQDWITSHAWSLSIEEFFYLFWPLVFRFRMQTRIRVALLFIMISPVSKLIFLFTHWEFLKEIPLFDRMDAIAVGCFFALQREACKALLKPLAHRAIGVCFIFFIGCRYLPWLLAGLESKALNQVIHVFYGSLMNLIIAFVLLASTQLKEGIGYSLLNLGPLQFLGKISYSLYLWQQFFLYYGNFGFNSFPLNLIYLFLTALFSWYVIEKPFLAWREQIDFKRKVE